MIAFRFLLTPKALYSTYRTSPLRNLSFNRPLQSFRCVLGRSMASKQELQSAPGVCKTPDSATKDFLFQQTMLRVKNPKISLDFYTRVLGMTLLDKHDLPDLKFSLYMLGYESTSDIPEDGRDRTIWAFGSKACLELVHNWGTESDDSHYHSGNSEPKGFGHIGVAVPDVYAACDRFRELGVEFVKEPDGGSMKGIAFIKDPDGYWVEILNPEGTKKILHK